MREMTRAESSSVLFPGPWRHRFVPANGARFHVAEAGPEQPSAPLVVLLHGFPQCWWSWRHQLPALADAGYRVAAMDLRGYGASDKPPLGNAVPTQAHDVAGVIRSLGAERAVVVGSGYGAVVAWSMPAYTPEVVRAIASIGAPHPLQLRQWARGVFHAGALGWLASVHTPYFPERSLVRGVMVSRLLAEWGADGWPSEHVRSTYELAMGIPFVAHSACEQLRWAMRSVPRRDGRRFAARLKTPIRVPVLHLAGTADGLVRFERSAAEGDLGGPDYRFEAIRGAGHFLAEEAPDQVSALMVDWLRQLAR